ncbi:MAG: hypothetical protein ACRDT0_16265 [Pseudonocardiaceae bacterium]
MNLAKACVLGVGAIGSAIAIIFGLLSDIKQAVSGIGWPGVLVIFETVLAFGALVLVANRSAEKYRQGGLRGVKRWVVVLVLIAVIALVSLGLSAPIVANYLTGSGNDRKSTNGTAAPLDPDRSRPMPTATSTSNEPVCSYLDKVDVPISTEDVNINIETGGFVRQTFYANSDQVGAVAVIIARQFRGESFSTEEIGLVRLALSRIDKDGVVVEGVPLALVGSDQSPSLSGVTQQAGPNNKDTIFELVPVQVQNGARYAITVYNDEPDVVLSFSIRPQGNGNPVTWRGEIGDTMDETRSDRALAGYVCRMVPP